MPDPRQYLAAATGLDGRIYAIGGSTCGDNPSCFTGDMDVYDPRTNAWSTVTPMPTGRAMLAATTGPDGRIYALGGCGDACPDNTVEAYDPTTNSWTTLAPLGTARQELSAATGADGRIYAIGGQAAWGNTNTVEAYDPYGATWTWVPVAPMTMARYYQAAAVGPDGRIYVVGGYTSQNGSNDGTVEGYGPSIGISPQSGPPGAGITLSGTNFGANATVSVYWGSITGTLLFTATTDGSGNMGSRAFQVPGDASPGANRVFAEDDQSLYPVSVPIVVGQPTPAPTPTNTPIAPLASEPPYWLTGLQMRGTVHEGAAAVGGDGRIYVMGGCTTVGCYSSSVQAFDPAANTWASVTAMPWTTDDLAAATGLDGRIYVMGGCDPWAGCPLGQAAVYDPSTNTWTALPTDA